MVLLATLRTTLLLAFKSLPLLLIAFISFLTFGLGNTSLFLLLSGHIFIVPFITELSHYLTNASPSLALLEINPISELASEGPVRVNVFPSYWMAHISFFFGYLIANAADMFAEDPKVVLQLVAGASSDAVKVSVAQKMAARKEKAQALLITLSVFFVLLTAMRVIATGAETLGGVLFAFFILGGMGAGWYFGAQALGAVNSDIFGISMQMMSPETAATKPKTCVYTGRP